MRRSAHAPHAGRCAWHVRRPWRSMFRCSSRSCPRGVSASIVSCSSSNGAAAGTARAACRPARRACRPARRASRRRTAARRRRSCGRHPAASTGTAWASGTESAGTQSSSSTPGLGPGLRDRREDRLDPRRLDLRDPAAPDRLLDLVDRRVADLLPAREALAQPEIGDVAVAVVGRLRQDRQDQLASPSPCGRRTGCHRRAAAGRGSRIRDAARAYPRSA